jgi:hypothetical protein
LEVRDLPPTQILWQFPVESAGKRTGMGEREPRIESHLLPVSGAEQTLS